MKEIQYKIKNFHKDVFEIIIPDQYDRGMLFMRVQEYFESNNSEFRGKNFDIFDFMKWYTTESKNDCGFTYTLDWDGFNFPLTVAIKCYKNLPDKYLTKYDKIFISILGKILKKIDKDEIKKIYIIGYDKLNSMTMHHERYHASYFVDSHYRREADNLTMSISLDVRKKLIKNLHNMGYYKGVMMNELQGYLRGKDWDKEKFSKGINLNILSKIHKKYQYHLGKIKVF